MFRLVNTYQKLICPDNRKIVRNTGIPVTRLLQEFSFRSASCKLVFTGNEASCCHAHSISKKQTCKILLLI